MSLGANVNESVNEAAKAVQRPIIKAIDHGLEQLLKVEVAEYAKGIFKVDKYVRDKMLFAKVRRLRISIENFDSANQGIGLVAFIAHFSAGKSSTINNVLQISGTAQERATGRHPTDDKITIVCRPEYREQFRSLITLPGGHFQLQPIEHDLLRNICIVDTPGAGDPSHASAAKEGSLEFDDETVRDFLPACDHIIYLFNAVTPFDSADMPALKMVNEFLPFIPISFGVTRADEYRRNKNEALSRLNIDTDDVNEDMIVLQRRLSTLLGKRIDTSHIFLLDNLVGYGLDELRLFIEKVASSKTDLFQEKTAYYGRRSEVLRDEVLAIVESKSNAWKSVWDDIEGKRKNFADPASRWDGTKNSWTIVRAKIADKRVKYFDLNVAIEKMPAEWTQLSEFTDWIRNNNESLKKSCKWEASRLSESNQAQWNNLLRRHLVIMAAYSIDQFNNLDKWLADVCDDLTEFVNVAQAPVIQPNVLAEIERIPRVAETIVRNRAADLLTRHKRISVHLAQNQQGTEIWREIDEELSNLRAQILRFLYVVGGLAQALILARDSELFKTLEINREIFDAVRDLPTETAERMADELILQLKNEPKSALDELIRRSAEITSTMATEVGRSFSVPAISAPDLGADVEIDLAHSRAVISTTMRAWEQKERVKLEQFVERAKNRFVARQFQIQSMLEKTKAIRTQAIRAGFAIGALLFCVCIAVFLLGYLEHVGVKSTDSLYAIILSLITAAIPPVLAAIWYPKQKAASISSIISLEGQASIVDMDLDGAAGILMESTDLDLVAVTAALESDTFRYRDSFLAKVSTSTIGTEHKNLARAEACISVAESNYKLALDQFAAACENFSGDSAFIETTLKEFSDKHWDALLAEPLKVLLSVNESLETTRDNIRAISFSAYHHRTEKPQ